MNRQQENLAHTLARDAGGEMAGGAGGECNISRYFFIVITCYLAKEAQDGSRLHNLCFPIHRQCRHLTKLEFPRDLLQKGTEV